MGRSEQQKADRQPSTKPLFFFVPLFDPAIDKPVVGPPPLKVLLIWHDTPDDPRHARPPAGHEARPL